MQKYIQIHHKNFHECAGICNKTSQNTNHIIEFSIKLDSNPEFTSSILVAYARAAYRLSKEGQCGCKTIFDIAPAYLSQKTTKELRETLL